MLVWELEPFPAPIDTFEEQLVESFLILKNLLGLLIGLAKQRVGFVAF